MEDNFFYKDILGRSYTVKNIGRGVYDPYVSRDVYDTISCWTVERIDNSFRVYALTQEQCKEHLDFYFQIKYNGIEYSNSCGKKIVIKSSSPDGLQWSDHSEFWNVACHEICFSKDYRGRFVFTTLSDVHRCLQEIKESVEVDIVKHMQNLQDKERRRIAEEKERQNNEERRRIAEEKKRRIAEEKKRRIDKEMQRQVVEEEKRQQQQQHEWQFIEKRSSPPLSHEESFQLLMKCITSPIMIDTNIWMNPRLQYFLEDIFSLCHKNQKKIILLASVYEEIVRIKAMKNDSEKKQAAKFAFSQIIRFSDFDLLEVANLSKITQSDAYADPEIITYCQEIVKRSPHTELVLITNDQDLIFRTKYFLNRDKETCRTLSLFVK